MQSQHRHTYSITTQTTHTDTQHTQLQPTQTTHTITTHYTQTPHTQSQPTQTQHTHFHLWLSEATTYSSPKVIDQHWETEHSLRINMI
ncbi:hypothetical protein FKM82_022921 [Ascaphus truei]